MLEIIIERWPIVWAISSTIFAIAMFFLSKTYAKREVVDHLSGRIDAIERQVAALPNQGDFHTLQLDIAALRGDIREVGAILTQVKYINNLITDHKFKDKT